MITPLPGITPTKPGSATRPFFGVVPKVVDEKGNEVPRNSGGKLVLTKPWPSMLRTLWGDDDRFKKAYFSEFPGKPGIYFTGDGARQDKDGYFWIVGRIDDVLNVSGHRIGTAEIESALVSHPAVAEAAAVGRPDELKGQALVVFVTLKSTHTASEQLKEELRAHVGKEIGSLAKPGPRSALPPACPRPAAEKSCAASSRKSPPAATVKGDTTTLEDFSVVAALQVALPFCLARPVQVRELQARDVPAHPPFRSSGRTATSGPLVPASCACGRAFAETLGSGYRKIT